MHSVVKAYLYSFLNCRISLLGAIHNLSIKAQPNKVYSHPEFYCININTKNYYEYTST